MTRLHRIAFIGNQLPRRCGIATFAEKRPVAAHLFDQRGVALRDQDLFLLSSFRNVAAERIGDERVTEGNR